MGAILSDRVQLCTSLAQNPLDIATLNALSDLLTEQEIEHCINPADTRWIFPNWGETSLRFILTYSLYHKPFALRLSYLPYGEWTEPKPFGNVYKATRDVIVKFLIIAEVPNDRGYLYKEMEKAKVGDIVHQVRKKHWRKLVGKLIDEGHDICCSCGADNGPPGASYRRRDDCYKCGAT